jgi:uncharacterized membrane protein
MKLNYHPPHLILNHFPSALFPMDFVCAALAFYRQDSALNYAAFYALAGGVMVGWLAAVFGLADLLKIPKEKQVAQQTGFIHGGLNMLVLSAYSVLFMLQWKAPEITYNSAPVLVLKAVLLLFLIGGNYLGGQLVLKYKIGTINNDLKQQ